MQATENTQLGTRKIYTEYARKGLQDEITSRKLIVTEERLQEL